MILVSAIIFSIGGTIIGYLLFNRKYLRYKLYWERLREKEGKFRITKEIAGISQINIDQLMNGIEDRIDREES